MEFVSFSHITAWVLTHGYALMFVGMLFAGPAVTAAGAFGAALRLFNVWIVFLLSVSSSLFADVVHYAIGFWGRQKLVDRYGARLGVTKARIREFEALLHKHMGKTIATVKLIPFLATPGLLMAGITRMPLKKYVWWNVVVTVPSSLAFLVIGYYFGAAYETIDRYLNLGGLFVFVSFVVFILLAHIYKRSSRRLAERIESAQDNDGA